MKLGELFVELGVKGDTKKLKETLKQMKEAEEKITRQIKKEQELTKATTEEQKALIKKKYALQEDISKTQQAIEKKQKFNNTIKSSIANIRNVAMAVTGAVVALDRMGNALLKNNQAYMTFNRSTGIGFDRLNKMTTVAQLSGMNMSPEQVMSDIQGMQQRLYRTALEGGDTKIFQMLGFNPLGMKSEQLIDKLRSRIRGMSAQQITYTLEELGLSQEWVNVLTKSDKKYKEMLAKSKELTLSTSQRKKLDSLVAQQQETNLRFTKVMNELLIQILPYVQKIMSAFINWVQPIAENEKACKSILKSLGDILKIMLVMKGINIFAGALKGLGGILGGLGLTGGLGAKGLGKIAGKGALRGLGLAIPGLNLLMGGWLIYDIVKAGLSIKDALSDTAKNIQNGAEELEDEINKDEYVPPESNATSFLNRNIKAMFTNNFYNNPQPAGQVSSEMATLIGRYAGVSV